jgi:cytochrome c-type biogenesis protein CcmI
MGLITGILGLPLAPLRGTIAIAELLKEQAEAEMLNPANIRAQLEEIDRQREAGLLDEDEAEAWEDELVARLMQANAQGRGEAP